MKLTIY